MSIVMDSQDLCGALRNLTLIVMVRSVRRSLTKADILKFFEGQLMVEIRSFAAALAPFSGVDESSLASAVDELLEADDEYLQKENINMMMALFCGSPVPTFTFVEHESIQSVALFRPFLHTANNLLHAAVRLRMQIGPSTSPTPFWGAFLRLVYHIGGKDRVASSIAVTTLTDVASDMVVGNWDAATRTDDPVLLDNIMRVLEELRSLALLP